MTGATLHTVATDDETPAAPHGAAPDTAAPDKAVISRGRLIAIDALIAFTTLLAVVGMLSIWANRLLFNPDNWETTSTQLLQNSDIRSATANYLTDQLYANVNVAGVIKSGLPTKLEPLAGPAAGALRNVAVQGVELALSRPRVQALWGTANRAADQTFIAIVNGGKGAVGVNNGVVTLKLSSIVGNIASRLGLPADISSKLPPSIATLTVFRSSQLRLVQDAGNAVKSLALWLTILVPLLYAAAIALARGHRRRTLMTVGFAVVLAGVIGIAGRAVLESQLSTSLTNDASLQPTIRAVVTIATQILGQIASAFVLIGVVFVVAAWFAGPAHPAVVTRRAFAPFLREQPLGAFATTAGVMLLVFIWDPIPATGTPVGVIVFLALAMFATEVLRRQTAREFPDAQRGEAIAAIRARWTAFRERRHETPRETAGHQQSIPDQLERLAALQSSGAITASEYDAAKQALLST